MERSVGPTSVASGRNLYQMVLVSHAQNTLAEKEAEENAAPTDVSAVSSSRKMAPAQIANPSVIHKKTEWPASLMNVIRVRNW